MIGVRTFGSPLGSRVEIKGKWPDVALFIDGTEIGGVIDLVLNIDDEGPQLTLTLDVSDLDVEVDDTLLDGWVSLRKQREPDGMYRVDRVVLNP